MKTINYPFNINVTAITTIAQNGNMAFQVGNDKEDVLKNRIKLQNALNVDKEHLVFVHQSHSDVIKEVTNEDLGKGSESFESGVEADGLYTKELGLAVGIFHADCVPVLFYEKEKGIVGVIHSGYKGTINHVVCKMLREVISKESLNPNNIYIYIGPHRRVKTFLLTEENEHEIEWKDVITYDHHLDMTSTVIRDITRTGIPLANIQDCGFDTVSSNYCFSAYKKTPIGRMASVIMLKKELL